MASIDLRQFVSRRSGPWSKSDDVGTFNASLLKLSQPDDLVTLNGPLSVRVGIHVRNQFLLGGQAGDEQTQTIASYRLDIPPGQSWTYDYPTSGESLLFAVGSNARFQVTIEPSVGGIDYYDTLGVDPYHTHSPCGCQKTPCSCRPAASSDLPCDFAVGNNRNLGEFFPSACEPCTPGSFVRMPPLAGPRLSVPPASGGCTRTNYFNGMFITKEDLLTDQRNMRIKQQLQNRAMGQGVVWGLGVGLNGGSVVVQPGYAVDCCGNDITITSPYQVDCQALVSDPAAAAELSRGGPRRMHLLLEYFECPEDPRPVHGDACSPETTHCEMGRIRETARLRLVPPRDLDTSGPIQDFLNSLPKPDTNNANPQPTRSELTPATKGTNTPFSLEALVMRGLIPSENLKFQLQPVFGEERRSTPKKAEFANLEQERAIEIMMNLRVPDSILNRFISAPIISIISASPGGAGASFKLFTDPFPSQEIMFSVFMDMRKFLDSTRDGLPGFVTIGVNSWSVVKQNETTPIADGNTTITIAWSVLTIGKQIELTISTGTEGRIQSIRIPCLTEACDPEGGRLFPVTPPWMHDLPAGSGRAIDFQVLQAALNYVRRLEGFSSATNIAAFNQRLVAQFSKLFDAWCRESLYRGPRCVGEPHGAVIGCAVADGKAGRIVSVDPWGGRRWVLHFPLITHWTGLAGVAPLDYLASKFFEFICCIASYGRRLTQKPIDPQFVAGSNFEVSELSSSSIALGTSQLVFDSEESLAKRTNNAKLTFRKLGFAEFLQQTLRATVQSSTQPIKESATVYSLSGFDRFFLVVPETQAAASSPSTPTPVVPVAPLLDSDSIQRFVGRQITINSEIKPIPRLLRSLIQDLSIQLMRTMPLTEPVASETRLLEQLKLSGIGTVAELLSADAERLFGEVLGGNFAIPLAGLLDSNDQQAVKLVASVASVTRDQSQLGLTVRGDLQNKVLLKQFAKALVKQVNESLGAKTFTEKSLTQLIEELVGATQ